MTTFPEYGAVRNALADLAERLDPNAAPVPPTAWERLLLRLRSLF
jgi:hypothetical protein